MYSMVNNNRNSIKALLVGALFALLPGALAKCCSLSRRFDYDAGVKPLSISFVATCPDMFAYARGIASCMETSTVPGAGGTPTASNVCQTVGLSGFTTTYQFPFEVEVDLVGVCCNNPGPGNGPGTIPPCDTYLPPPNTP